VTQNYVLINLLKIDIASDISKYADWNVICRQKGEIIMFDRNKWAELITKAQGEMSLNDFAKFTGVNKASLSNYKNCNTPNRPKYETIIKLSNACPNISLAQFIIAADYTALLPCEYQVKDELTKDIVKLLIEENIIHPDTPMSFEEKDNILRFIRKCIHLKKDV